MTITQPPDQINHSSSRRPPRFLGTMVACALAFSGVGAAVSSAGAASDSSNLTVAAGPTVDIPGGVSGCGGLRGEVRIAAFSELSATTASAEITGRVVLDDAPPPAEWPGVGVWLDGSEYSCVEVDPATGLFTTMQLDPGVHTVLVWGPGQYLSQEFTVTVADDATSVDMGTITLHKMQPAPTDGSVALRSGTTDVAIPEDGQGSLFAYYAEPLDVTLTQQCVGATSASYSLTFFGHPPLTGPLVEGPAGTYKGQVPQAYPAHGFGALALTINCPAPTPPTVIRFDIYFDPSGVVVDQWGSPIEGAEVELWQYLWGYLWEKVPDGDPVMDANVNNVNPFTTEADGRFRWDVQPGKYRLQVKVPGVSSLIVTNEMDVQPIRTGLVIVATVPGALPPVPSLVPWADYRPPLPIPPGSLLKVNPGQKLSATDIVWPGMTSTPDQGSTISWPSSTVVYEDVVWTLDGEIAGDGPDYTVPAKAAGQVLQAKVVAHRVVSGHKDGIGPDDGGALETTTFTSFAYTTASVLVSGTPAPVDPVLGLIVRAPVPQITGTPVAGGQLTAQPGVWDAGVALSYQWLANGQAVSGATGPVIKLVPALVGKAISVLVTGTKSGFRSESRVSGATAPVAAAPTIVEPTPTVSAPAPTTAAPTTAAPTTSAPATAAPAAALSKLAKAPKPVITGKAKVGKRLKVKLGKWDAGVVKTVQWYANGKAIKGAIKTKLKVTKKLVGKRLTVKVTGTKVGFKSRTVTSAKTSKVKAKK